MAVTSERATGVPTRLLRVLAISDEVDERLYSPSVVKRFGGIDLLLSCGDLPDHYLDYVASMLNAPMYGVRGNHDVKPRHDDDGDHEHRRHSGLVDLHGRVVEEHGLLIGGLDGCLRYNSGQYQFTEGEMQRQVALMVPRLLANKARYGRYLDVFVTHASPKGIHDQPDRCHQGFEVYRWFLRTFKPRYHLHGHIHVYDNRTVTETRYGETTVLNAYRYRELSVPLPSAR
jgi:uncharacterized protein